MASSWISTSLRRYIIQEDENDEDVSFRLIEAVQKMAEKGVGCQCKAKDPLIPVSNPGEASPCMKTLDALVASTSVLQLTDSPNRQLRKPAASIHLCNAPPPASFRIGGLR